MKRKMLILIVCAAFAGCGAYLFLLPRSGETRSGKPARVAPQIEQERQRVEVALGRQTGIRREASRQLGREIAPDQIKDLYEYVKSREIWEPALKNNVMNALRAQKQPPAGLTDLFISIYRDRAQDPVLRAYALQHLAAWHAKTTAPEQEKIQALFWEAVREKEGSIPGTALLSLNWLSGRVQGFDATRFRGEALQMASDPQTGELARITALQVCAEHGVREALPVARELAEKSSSTPVRLSALAALGNLGDAQDRAYLKKVAEGSDARLQVAAESALKRMKPAGRSG